MCQHGLIEFADEQQIARAARIVLRKQIIKREQSGEIGLPAIDRSRCLPPAHAEERAQSVQRRLQALGRTVGCRVQEIAYALDAGRRVDLSELRVQPHRVGEKRLAVVERSLRQQQCQRGVDLVLDEHELPAARFGTPPQVGNDVRRKRPFQTVQIGDTRHRELRGTPECTKEVVHLLNRLVARRVERRRCAVGAGKQSGKSEREMRAERMTGDIKRDTRARGHCAETDGWRRLDQGEISAAQSVINRGQPCGRLRCLDDPQLRYRRSLRRNQAVVVVVERDKLAACITLPEDIQTVFEDRVLQRLVGAAYGQDVLRGPVF